MKAPIRLAEGGESAPGHGTCSGWEKLTPTGRVFSDMEQTGDVSPMLG